MRVAVVPCEPFRGDTVETIAYRRCDLCEETVVEDIWAERPWREFWLQVGGIGDGLSICENCIAAYLAEKPEDLC